ncbi:MAG: thioesterase domain-containing protein [Lutisporaceae bacterium]
MFIIEKYVNEIINIQSDGAYILLGYCMGGRLAFRVAKELEKRGYRVSNLIILDGYRQLEKNPPSNEDIEQYKNKLSQSIDEDKKYLMFKEEILEKTIAYYRYCGELVDDGTINANIYLVKASDIDITRVQNNGWSEATTCNYTVHQGFGQHNEMLEAGFVEGNAGVLVDILDGGI